MQRIFALLPERAIHRDRVAIDVETGDVEVWRGGSYRQLVRSFHAGPAPVQHAL